MPSVRVGRAALLLALSAVTTAHELGCGGAVEPTDAGAASGSSDAMPPKPPVLVSAEVVSGNEVRLTFSEAMAPVDDVDPTSFRLSAAMTVAAGGSYVQTCRQNTSSCAHRYASCDWLDCSGSAGASTHHHPSLVACCKAAVAARDVTTYYDGGDIASLRSGDAADEIVLQLTKPFASDVCGGQLGLPSRAAYDSATHSFPRTLLLHYAPAGTPLTSQAGQAVGAIAPAWATAAAGGAASLDVDGLLTDAPFAVDRHALDAMCDGRGCTDGLVDADEGDVDCGGYFCTARCQIGQGCSIADDCATRVCEGGRCVAATACSDGIQDDGETDVDCGGDTSCERCPGGRGCTDSSDCESYQCSSGVCVAATCDDTVQDGDETGVDCGGSCPLSCVGGPCTSGAQCLSGDCRQGLCAPDTVKQIDGNGCLVTGQGAARCWGENLFGSAGDGTTVLRAVPVPVQGLGSGVRSVAAGESESCAITDAGALLCWGSNFAGEIGDGTTQPRLMPTPVAGLSQGVAAVALGSAESVCALTTAGAVLCWGDNSFGELGDGTLANHPTPAPVAGLESGVNAISAGSTWFCAIQAPGRALCWGQNEIGELGDGTHTRRATPVAVVGLDSGVTAIAAGVWTTCALKDTGAVLCWGDNGYGNLGNGTFEGSTTPVVALASGAKAVSVRDGACASSWTGAA